MRISSRIRHGLRHSSVLAFAVLVGGFTLSCASRAYAVTSTPNAAITTYNLAAGANSGRILPPLNVPVLVMGTCITSGVRGVGQVTMLHISGQFLEWTGINSPSNGTLTSGFSGTAGVDIVQIDFNGGAVIEVNDTDTFRVHNASTSARAGYVTMIW